MTSERIPLPSNDELDHANREFLKSVPPFNVWRMIAGAGIGPEFAQPLSRIFDPTWFDPVDREIVLFRTCSRNGSTYEVSAHRVISQFPPSIVDAVMSDDGSGLEPWHRSLCRMVDEMTDNARITPESIAELRSHYGSDPMALRAIMVMAWFQMLTRFVDSSGVPLEDPAIYQQSGGEKGPLG